MRCYIGTARRGLGGAAARPDLTGLTLNGAMPQGSWLGPLSFLIMTDDLDPGCVTHKYVDDTTLY